MPVTDDHFGCHIGNTPMVKLSSKTNAYSHKGINIYVKLEYCNPTGSIKDRMVQYILDHAMKTDKIRPGGTVVEASSGNTGTSLSMFCNQHGLKTIIFTNTNCSDEKINNMKLHGATVHVNDDYKNIALTHAKEHPEWFHLNQYHNYENAQSYYHTLGPEIWDDMQGQLNYFVAGKGTSGTISGTGSFLKSKNKEIKIVLADVCEKSTRIEGVNGERAMHFADVIDDVLKVQDQDAFDMCHVLANNETIFAGGSGGFNVCASLKLAELLAEKNDHLNENHPINNPINPINIITVIPDSGLKYMSKIYNPAWLRDNNIAVTSFFSSELSKPEAR